MTPEDIQRAVEKAIEQKMSPFYVDRETHYKDHLFISELRTMFDMSKAEMCKNAVKWIFTIAAGLIMVGWAVSKGIFSAR